LSGARATRVACARTAACRAPPSEVHPWHRAAGYRSVLIRADHPAFAEIFPEGLPVAADRRASAHRRDEFVRVPLPDAFLAARLADFDKFLMVDLADQVEPGIAGRQAVLCPLDGTLPVERPPSPPGLPRPAACRLVVAALPQERRPVEPAQLHA
jgi:hypothetical protein